jgi:hypothetical protein
MTLTARKMILRGLLLMVLLKTCTLSAQQLDPMVMAAGSGTMSNGFTSIYWTIGETVTATFGQKNQLSSGYSQSTYTVTGIKEDLLSTGLILFPNPASDILSIKIDHLQLKPFYFELFGATGNIIMKGVLRDEKTDLNCSRLMPSTYWLKITNGDNTILETFKIVKL